MSAAAGVTAVFLSAAARYWLAVHPQLRRQLSRSDREAERIPDPALRALAVQARGKRGNVEGAAAFAAFVPRATRKVAVRALVAFQSAYNYLDLLAEQPGPYPEANARRLHEALLVALDPSAPHPDYYEYRSRAGEEGEHAVGEGEQPPAGDGGYLMGIVDDCREALAELPSYGLVAPAARRIATRIVDFQGHSQAPRETIERWGRELCAETRGLEWWEVAAAAGTSLGIYALIGAATDPTLSATEVNQLEDAYFPWIGALHSLLDSAVDAAEDRASSQLSLVGCYPSREAAAEGITKLSERARVAAADLPHRRRHTLILVAMASYYLSLVEGAAGERAGNGTAGEGPGADGRALLAGVPRALGRSIWPSLLIFRIRRFLTRDTLTRDTVTRRPRTQGENRADPMSIVPAVRGASAQAVTGRGADARVA